MRALAILLLLTVPAAADEIPPAALSAVTDLLKDPHSAQFRRVYVRGDNVCGELNARNEFGGYVGFRKFHVGTNGEDPHIWTAEVAPAFDWTFGIICKPAD